MRKVIKLGGEICPNCASKIEHAIAKLDGVTSVRVNAMTLKFTLEAEDDRFQEALASSIKIFDDIEPDCEVLV